MKKYLVIGNPIKHSLSPKIHNHWIKKNNIDAIYEKIEINENQLTDIILEIKDNKISGANITVPFKKSIIPLLDKLTPTAKSAQSVNTIYKIGQKIIGDNTDVDGFIRGLNYKNHIVKDKKIFILGAGGVVSSIILALQSMGAFKIVLSNRTKEKTIKLKEMFKDLQILEWGDIPEFDIIINATSVGLEEGDKINLNLKNSGTNKLYYDIIYNPTETNFLKEAKLNGNKTENGRMMFVYQAYLAFNVWHKVKPEIDEETISLLNS